MFRKCISCLIIAAMLVFVALGTVGCNSEKAASSKKTGAPDQVTFLLNWLPEEPIYWAAIDKGFWAEQNLDVKILRGTGSVDTVTKIGAKKADFGKADVGNLILARAREGVRVKAVASYQASTVSVVVFRKSSGIKEPKDLEGKSIVTTATSPMLTFWPAFAEAAGIDKSKVELKIVDPSLTRSIFIQGEVDAFFIKLCDVPQVERVAGEPLEFFAYKDYGDLGRYGDVIFAHEDTIAQNPDLVRRFVAGYLKGFRYCLEHPAEVGEIVKKYAPQNDPEGILKAWKADMENDIVTSEEARQYGLGWISEERMAQTIEIVSKAYTLEKGITPETVYTTEFLPEHPVYPPKK